MQGLKSNKATILSGIQPTGEMHLGNYFGAVKNWVELQESYQAIYSIVDLHAMTMPYNPKELKKNTENLAIEILAAGIDPDKSILFIQSLVPEHTELYWILSCITPYGDLTRQTQFKDKSEQVSERSDEFISAGLFTYPTLQAADILVYRAQLVPVGKDQTQHVELSREIARRFNQTFGEEYFPEPKVLSTPTPKIQSLAAPEKKMSKSLGHKHYIGLFEEENTLRKKVRSAITDSGITGSGITDSGITDSGITSNSTTGNSTTGSDNTPQRQMSPGVANLFGLIRACEKNQIADSLMKDYEAGKLKYANLKDTTADCLVELTSEMRKRRDEIAADKKSVMQKINEMSEKARDLASQTLKEVRRLVGLPKRKMFFQASKPRR